MHYHVCTTVQRAWLPNGRLLVIKPGLVQDFGASKRFLIPAVMAGTVMNRINSSTIGKELSEGDQLRGWSIGASCVPCEKVKR